MTETEHIMLELRLKNVEIMLERLHEDLEAIKDVLALESLEMKGALQSIAKASGQSPHAAALAKRSLRGVEAR